MAASSTLYSKLRLLVAKLYKAEKLYSSMSNLSSGRSSNDPTSFDNLRSKHRSSGARHPANRPSSGDFGGSGLEDVFSPAILVEYANEVRSVEWYRVHSNYRQKLNQIFTEGNTANLPLKLNKVWHDFIEEFGLAEKGFLSVRDQGREAFEREEYSFLFKVSAELVRRRARLQALKVIHDELESLIGPAQRLKGSIIVDEIQAPELPPHASNVIPIKRRIAR